MALATVDAGVYLGRNLAYMTAELARYQTAFDGITPGPRNIISASANGSSFTYGPGGGMSLDQWRSEIQWALSRVSDTYVGEDGVTVASFTGA